MSLVQGDIQVSGLCPSASPSFILTTDWLSDLFPCSVSRISTFPVTRIQMNLFIHTRFLIPVTAFRCHCWYGFLSTYLDNTLILHAGWSVNKRWPCLNARLVLTPGLQYLDSENDPVSIWGNMVSFIPNFVWHDHGGNLSIHLMQWPNKQTNTCLVLCNLLIFYT